VPGETSGVNYFRLAIEVTEGTNTKDEKAEFVAQAFRLLGEAVGNVSPASYVMIHDLRGDAWGYGGQTQEYRYVTGKVAR
jgi:4-oxalocrotonate tautomerase